MPDKSSIEKIDKLHPMIRAKALMAYYEVCNHFEERGILVRITQGLRTFEEQDALYAKGRTVPGKIVTNAKGGQSIHNYGLAFDIVLLYDKNGDGIFETVSWDTKADFDNNKQSDWMEVVSIFKRHGFNWGGDWRSFKDMPHFEEPNQSWRMLLSKYKDRRFLENTKYVSI